jgi:hypothetical protein
MTSPAPVASAPAPRTAVVGDTAKPAAPTAMPGVLPVPVQPPPPRAVADLPPQPPTVIETTPPSRNAPIVHAPRPRESWFSRVLRSGRASSPAEFERINGDGGR